MSWRNVTAEAKLLLIGIPVLVWTMLPIYHLTLFAISPKEQAMGGQLWPDQPTLHNFEVVFQQQHHYLNHFWLQMWNSLFIAVMAGLLTLVVATGAAFAISRLKVLGGRMVMNLALLTYFIPAAFLAVPMYKTMGDFNSVYLLTGGGPADLTHVLATLGIRYLRLDQVDLSMAAIVMALPAVLPLVYFMMKRLSR